MKFAKAALFLSAPVLLLAACSEPAPGGEAKTTTTAVSAPDVQPASLDVPPLVTPSASPLAQSIDKATYIDQPTSAQALRDIIIRAEVLLSRAHFSPGVIDGQDGDNLKDAVTAYETANNLPADGKLDAKVWQMLARDTGPAMTDYVITADDVKGPFAPIPKDYKDMAKLDRLGYATPAEALAEKFHMDEALLKALNPNVDFGVAGTKIVVAAAGPDTLPAPVTLVEVDKTKRQVRAFGADGKMLASYPATIGSGDMPTPSGTVTVNAVAPAPTWTYDPSKLNFGDKSLGKLTIAAGPNNPVGAVWIDLSKPTYGIHGAPEPRMVGKAASHGCVRLTNWDVQQLSKAVTKGTKVVFLGADAAPGKAKA